LDWQAGALALSIVSAERASRERNSCLRARFGQIHPLAADLESLLLPLEDNYVVVLERLTDARWSELPWVLRKPKPRT
jgi:hypothetical protein